MQSRVYRPLQRSAGACKERQLWDCSSIVTEIMDQFCRRSPTYFGCNFNAAEFMQ
jgi:hypothetical protein